MGFSHDIRETILAYSARHCCVCHQYRGINIEIHHIVPRAQGGEDTLENAIALCFDCHADAGHYFAGHPKGSKLSPDELRKHKDLWLEIVRDHKIEEPKNVYAQLSVKDYLSKAPLNPIFIRKKTSFLDRNFLRDTYSLLGKDVMEYIEESKKGMSDIFLDPYLQKVKTYDDYINYLNGDHIKENNKIDNTCQPVIHQIGAFREYRIFCRSNCMVDLKFTNCGRFVFEDYKLYLKFGNVVSVDTLNKRNSWHDMHAYDYNVHFLDEYRAEFIPKSNVLVQDDSVFTDTICFRPHHKAKMIDIDWELYARNCHITGQLQLSIKAEIIKEHTHRYVDNAKDMKAQIAILPKLEFD